MLQSIRIVLVNTTHPGNIGAVARAMKNMELNNLYLVSPKLFPHAEATARASGADDILQNATITSSLLEAVEDCQLVIGTSARERALPIEILNPKEAAEKVFTELETGEKIALVFGTENFGLTNTELKLCHYHLHIPTNNEFASLNLAAAVLIIAYELKMAFADQKINLQNEPKLDIFASIDELEFMYEHLEKILVKTDFLDPKNPRHLMERFRRLFGRTRLEKSEVNILRGMLSAIDGKVQ